MPNMKKKDFIGRGQRLLVLFLAIFLFFVTESCGNNTEGKSIPEKYSYYGGGNPYLPLWEHMPDGEPHVFEDPDNPGKYRIYVIGSHDVKFNGYCGMDIRAWSAPVEDLSNWRDEGPLFTYSVDGQWDVMYAPDLVEVKRKDGTKRILFVSA